MIMRETNPIGWTYCFMSSIIQRGILKQISLLQCFKTYFLCLFIWHPKDLIRHVKWKKEQAKWKVRMRKWESS